MTRQETIERWKTIIDTVFYAEAKLHEVWLPQLNEAKTMNEKERAHIADRYLEAIATEIVSGTSDEELAEMDSNN